eukprot:GAFH01000955.1.p2 GENE.GAFH01000955.1~~GAFH01000955.1.p2  ORF type:complete len:736 (-),score=385.89 GAFH01000955.1:67-2121(-)
MPLQAHCAKVKANPKVFVEELAAQVQALIAAHPPALIHQVQGVNGYFNIRLNRNAGFQLLAAHILGAAEKYGHSTKMSGKKVIIEHTSSNPNAPLHIGNLRNSILGSIMANIMKAVGYDVKQLFYVNDLGAQIGLTACVYSRIYTMVRPALKIDQWIGMVYAVANTMGELQVLLKSFSLKPVAAIADNAEKVAELCAAHAADGAEAQAKIAEYCGILVDLRRRQPDLVNTCVEVLEGVNIKGEAGKLNLAYEAHDPKAVKLYRKMTCDCLSGNQETLDTYDVRHDRFDYESELSWEGSSAAVLDAMKRSPYVVAPTQCNKEGKPEGGYLNLAQFITDSGLPVGKGGYQEEYPPLYVLRPDGSTLYTFRDCVYSLKKCDQADLVWNVICSEQNLAQEKVYLALKLLSPARAERLYHASYDLVKLPEGRMSGRRGKYVLADDLYEELKEAVREVMNQKYAITDGSAPAAPAPAPVAAPAAPATAADAAAAAPAPRAPVTADFFERVSHEVSTACMKYALVSASSRTIITFNMAKVVDFNDASGPFLLYNYARICSIFRKFESRVVAANPAMALCPLSQVQWGLLEDPQEWELLIEYLITFPDVVWAIAVPAMPARPALPQFSAHLLCDHLVSLVRLFSSYYKRVKIINPDPAQAPLMHARLWMCRLVQQVLGNGMKLLTMHPLDQM